MVKVPYRIITHTERCKENILWRVFLCLSGVKYSARLNDIFRSPSGSLGFTGSAPLYKGAWPIRETHHLVAVETYFTIT